MMGSAQTAQQLLERVGRQKYAETLNASKRGGVKDCRR